MAIPQIRSVVGAAAVFATIFVPVAPLFGQEAEEAAKAPSLGKIPFFKQSVGSWKGGGSSVVAGQKEPLLVTDVWKAGFVDNKGETVFVQEGKIGLSNGGAFSYRWIYRIDPEKKVIVGHFSDSNGGKGVSLVKLGAEGKKISVSPPDPATKNGMFTDVFFDGEGRYTYHAELRDAAGKATVKTKVACERVAAEEKAPVESKQPPAPDKRD
jgi:hypothetical protein